MMNILLLGMLPEAILWCYFGRSARKLQDIISGKGDQISQRILFGVEIGFALLLFALLGYLGNNSNSNSTHP